MKKLQTAGWLLALLMLVERIWKLEMVRHFFQRPLPGRKKSGPQSPETRTVLSPKHHYELISIIQPILSGDPTMSDCLESALCLKSAYPLEYIWLIDQEDSEGQRICQQLITQYPEQSIRIVLVPQPPVDSSPKTFKLIEGRKAAQGDVICVLDDDTILPTDGLDRTLPFLNQPGVGLAFGLPYYINFSNPWSSMVAAFVNGNSLLTYVPYISITDPFTINGMYYMMRSKVLDGMGGFDAIKHMFADDFAIAHLCRTHGYKLAQTPVLHGISTQVRDSRHYISLLQRWFVFPRESILRHVSWFDQLVLYCIGVVPLLFPFFLLLSLLLRPSWLKGSYTLLYFGCSMTIIDHINKRYLKSATPTNKRGWTLFMLILIPVQVMIALLSPQRVNWRGNIVQVERGGGFTYVKRRVDSPA